MLGPRVAFQGRLQVCFGPKTRSFTHFLTLSTSLHPSAPTRSPFPLTPPARPLPLHLLVGPRPPHSLLSQLYADAEANLTSSGAKKDDAAADATGAGAPLLEGKDKEADTKTVLPGGAAGAAAGAAADTFKNMFSEEKLAKVMTNMAMVPMFCILITFCRLRARVDLETEPQVFAKTWMMVSTACLFVQVLSCMLPDIPETPGNTSCCSLAKGWLYFLEVVNLGGMLGLYAGIGVICYSIFGLRFKEDQVKGATLPAAAADAGEASSGSASGSGSD